MGLNVFVVALLSMYLDETRYKSTLEIVERSEKNSEKDVNPSQTATLLLHNIEDWIIFTLRYRVIGFALLCNEIGPENSCHSLRKSEAN